MELVSVAAMAENGVPDEYEGDSPFSEWDEPGSGLPASVEYKGCTREEWTRTGGRGD